ncbi:MAG TPA: trehalose-phosphatase, partial [Candidatus Saccharimonadales bacterium]|nr:trehalose-phosphatase [Candidatus Saccharimonadales bacterium]
ASRTALLSENRIATLKADYANASSRLLLLDYDGVLMDFKKRFQDATPTPELSRLLKKLSNDEANTVVVISGRPRKDLQHWFEGNHIILVAEHGAFWRGPDGKWHNVPVKVDKDWQDQILPLMYKYAANTPGAVVEEKEQALVWHYRNAKPYYAQKYLVGLKRALTPVVRRLGLQMQQGNMILEVRPIGIDKGTATRRWLRHKPEFILALGDDYTDEDTFNAMPDHAYTVKVGRGRTDARYRLKNVTATLKLLEELSKR